jgi:hypothetical protein
MSPDDQSVLAEAILTIVELVRDILHPDSELTEGEFVQAIIEQVDNPRINPVIRKLEAGDA